MSASEKLKALEVRGSWLRMPFEELNALTDALPQIRALAEVAESIDEDRHKGLMTPFVTEDRLTAALAALDEALP